METFEIKSVTVQSGSRYVHYWTGRMQEIVTDKGVFIDNLPGITYGMQFPGHSWDQEIGKKIKANIVSSKGQNWLEYKGGAN